MIVITPEIMSLTNGREMLKLIRQIAQMTDAKFFMPNQFGNLNGLLSLINLKPLDEIMKRIADGTVDLVYFLGDTPHMELPAVKYKIYQNAFPAPAGLNPDVILPTCLWGESSGSYLNSQGEIKKFDAAVAPPGYSIPHLEALAQIFGASDQESLRLSQENIAEMIMSGWNNKRHPIRNNIPVHFDLKAVSADYPFLLIREKDQHVYNNLSLGDKLEGFGELVRPGFVVLNPSDAKAMGLKNEDKIELASSGKKNSFRAIIRRNIPKGVLFLQELDGNDEFETNPCPVNIRRENV